jgi:hypothetical protein
MLVLASEAVSGFLKVYRLGRSSCWFGEVEEAGLSLAGVRYLRVAYAPVTLDDLAAPQADVLAGFVLARPAAGLADSAIASDVDGRGARPPRVPANPRARTGFRVQVPKNQRIWVGD